MNNVRLEIEQAETLAIINRDDSNAYNIFKIGSFFYTYYPTAGRIKLTKSSDGINWTELGNVVITNIPSSPSSFSTLNNIEGVGELNTFEKDGVYYACFYSLNSELNNTLNTSMYGNNGEGRILHIGIVNTSNPLEVQYLTRIKYGYITGGVTTYSSQKSDNTPFVFFSSKLNKFGITTRRRSPKDGDITWHPSSDNNSHVGFGEQPTNDNVTGPSTGTELPTNRRGLNLFYSQGSTLNGGETVFIYDKVLNPEQAELYNYNPKIADVNQQIGPPARYKTIKPDFQWGAPSDYEGRILINMTVFMRDDRRAPSNDRGLTSPGEESENVKTWNGGIYSWSSNIDSSSPINRNAGLIRRDGPVIPVLFYSRDGVQFKKVHEQISSGTYTGEDDYYKTYLDFDEFAIDDTIDERSQLYFYRKNSNYTIEPNPIPTKEIKQAYATSYYVDGDNIYFIVSVRGYNHYHGLQIHPQVDRDNKLACLKLQKDRFFGWKATNSNAYITTKLMSVDSAINYINVNAKGSFKVQLLNANDSSLGYLTISNNDTFTSDEDEINKYIPLPTRAYNEFKLRFHLLTTNTKLFAFRFYYPNNLTNIPDPDVVNDVIPAPILVSPINGQNVPESGTLLTFQQSNGFVVSSVISGVNTFNRYRIDWTNNLSYFEPDVNGNYPSIPSGFGSTVFRVASSINEITGYMEVSRGFGGYSGETAYWRVRAEEIIDSANNIINYGEWSQVQSFTIT